VRGMRVTIPTWRSIIRRAVADIVVVDGGFG
jgi:hypothetical protein